jgi:glycosyltransferase involved in cell wall biosynthesis
MQSTHKRKLAIYIQYTNPAMYPPLQHGARILLKNGWDVTFLGIRGKESGDALRLPDDLGARLKTIPKWGKGWVLKLNYAVFAIWCRWMVRTKRPQLIYISDPLGGPAGLFAQRATNSTIIYHEHDSPEQNLKTAIGRVLSWARLAIIRRAKLCVFPNLKRAADLESQTHSSRFLQVMNCPGLDEVSHICQQFRDHTGLRVYYHGSIVPDRVPLSIIAALMELPDSVTLTIVGYETIGSQGYTKVLNNEVRYRNLQNRVKILGPHQRRELLNLCADHDVGLALIPTDTREANFKDMAGASVKVFEYLACGIPVLVSEVADFDKLFVQSGFALACEPRNAHSIAEALTWFLDHPEARVAMGKRGRDRVLTDWNYECQFAPVLNALAALDIRPFD